MTAAHGTYVAYSQARCRCQPCRKAGADYNYARAIRLIAEKHGQRPLWTDAGPAAAHVADLHIAGMPVLAVARAAGVAPTIAYQLHRKARIRTKDADALLAVAYTPAAWRSVPSGAAGRKVRALAALGWTHAASGVRLSADTWGKVARDAYTRIAATTDGEVDRVYRRLHMTPAPDGLAVRRLRTRARNQGWLPPLAWDDIDDGLLPEPVQNPGRRNACRCGELEHLLDSDEHPYTAAGRLGATYDALSQELRRHGRRDLADRITRALAAHHPAISAPPITDRRAS